MSFLPEEYTKPATGSGFYLRLKVGNTKIRILSDAITGWVDWDKSGAQNKPIRTKEKPERGLNIQESPKHFWSFVVWDYTDKAVKILEITQATIQNAIFELSKSDDWGDPKGYDITISRVGEQKEDVKYSVIPTPPKPLSEEIKKEYESKTIDLNELFYNGDPFNPIPGGRTTVEDFERTVEKKEPLPEEPPF